MMKIVIAIVILMSINVSFSGEKDTYDFLWLDPDKKVYVLQNKTYKKESKFYIDAGYLTSLTGDFIDTSGYFLKAGYYFHEEWGFEMGYIKYSNATNDSYESIKYINGTIPFVRKLDNTMYAMGIWSPFYGKINTFNKIVYFHWDFGFGLGMTNAESNVDSVSEPSAANTFEKEKHTSIHLKTSVKFQINKRTHLGLEFFNSNFKAKIPQKNSAPVWRHQNDIMLEIGFTF
jgi:outer membrane beta-barrel protein